MKDNRKKWKNNFPSKLEGFREKRRKYLIFVSITTNLVY